MTEQTRAPYHLTQFAHGVLANVENVSQQTKPMAEHDPDVDQLVNPFAPAPKDGDLTGSDDGAGSSSQAGDDTGGAAGSEGGGNSEGGADSGAGSDTSGAGDTQEETGRSKKNR